MSEMIKVTGMVIQAQPQGDNDKRIVIESCGLGKITAFARGARRPGNHLLAAANPFVMGEFSLIPGSSAYRLAEADVKEYFRELASCQPGVYIGFYFLDLIDYYGREGIDGTDMLNLLYMALKALMKESLDNDLVRRVFEIRLFALNGDFAPDISEDEAFYAILDYICRAPIGKLFSFSLDSEMLGRLDKTAEKARRRIVEREPKSLGIMEAFIKAT